MSDRRSESACQNAYGMRMESVWQGVRPAAGRMRLSSFGIPLIHVLSLGLLALPFLGIGNG